MSGLPKGWSKSTIEELTGVGGLATDGDLIESKDQDPHEVFALFNSIIATSRHPMSGFECKNVRFWG